MHNESVSREFFGWHFLQNNLYERSDFMLKKILCLMLAVSAVTLVSCGQNADVSSNPESEESSVVSESSVKKDLSDVKVEVGKAVSTGDSYETKFTSEYKEPFVVLCEATSSWMDSVHSAYVFMENGEGMAHGYETYRPYRCFAGDIVSKDCVTSFDYHFSVEPDTDIASRDSNLLPMTFSFEAETDIEKDGFLVYDILNESGEKLFAVSGISSVYSGHIKGSKNMLLQTAPEKLKFVPKFFFEVDEKDKSIPLDYDYLSNETVGQVS